MPTGYTHGIAEGKITTINQFAWECARAFGALIEMRDDPAGAKVPEFKPSEYQVNALKESEAVLKTFLAADDKALVAMHEAEHVDACRQRKRWREDAAEKRARYTAMLEQVRAFEPPTADHIELKKFMVSQIEESIRFDCSLEREADPVKPPFEKWREKKRAELVRSVDYHKEEILKERQRVDGRNAWVAALRAAVGPQP